MSGSSLDANEVEAVDHAIERWSSVTETNIKKDDIKKEKPATWLKLIFGIGPEHGDTPAMRHISYFGVSWLATTGLTTS